MRGHGANCVVPPLAIYRTSALALVIGRVGRCAILSDESDKSDESDGAMSPPVPDGRDKMEGRRRERDEER